MHRPPPDFEPRLYAPQRIAAVVATLADDGIAPALSLAGSDLDETALRAPSTRVSYAQTLTVFRNALRLATDSTLALRAGARMHATAYGTWGYALLSSPTYGEMLAFATRYRRVIGPLADMSYDPARDPAICSFEVLVSPDPSDDLYRFALEFTYAAHLTLSRDLYGKSFGFSAVRVAYPAPLHVPAYRELLGCPVQFGHPGNELQFAPAWCDRPTRQSDSITHALARETCQQFLSELSHVGGIASAVRRTLSERMPWRYPHMESMAKELSMEPRTLRRRLEAQGTSYRQILADVRQRLAIDYLRRTRMTTEEIASRLGYSDAANFRHAFVRWTGKTPHEYRTGRPPACSVGGMALHA